MSGDRPAAPPQTALLYSGFLPGAFGRRFAVSVSSWGTLDDADWAHIRGSLAQIIVTSPTLVGVSVSSASAVSPPSARQGDYFSASRVDCRRHRDYKTIEHYSGCAQVCRGCGFAGTCGDEHPCPWTSCVAAAALAVAAFPRWTRPTAAQKLLAMEWTKDHLARLWLAVGKEKEDCFEKISVPISLPDPRYFSALGFGSPGLVKDGHWRYEFLAVEDLTSVWGEDWWWWYRPGLEYVTVRLKWGDVSGQGRGQTHTNASVRVHPCQSPSISANGMPVGVILLVCTRLDLEIGSHHEPSCIHAMSCVEACGM